MTTCGKLPFEEKENVFLGIIGAFLFSLVGGLAWFGFHFFGFYSALSGVIGVLLAIKGYSLFSKKESIKGIIISAVIAFIVLAAAWYVCIGFDLMQAFREEYSQGNILLVPSFFECMGYVPDLLQNPEYGSGYYTDLILGLVLAFFGSIGAIIEKIKNAKIAKQKADAEKETKSTLSSFTDIE